MKKIFIDCAMIEVTRRCNMACAHCLRGNAQNKEMDGEYLDMFFAKLSGIGTLTITGGEPSIVPHKIGEILHYAAKYNVTIGNFYIATNAKEVSDDFLLAIMRLHCYCSDNETSCVNYSNDTYHDKIKQDNIKRLSVFSFVEPKYSKSFPLRNGEYEINDGRAKTNGIGHRKEKGIESAYFCIDDYIGEWDDETFSILGEMNVYLNCKGNIVCGCDWSYKSQDKKANIVCHVSKFNPNTVTAYLKRFES